MKSDLVDGAIGEGSQFHQTYGYYGQGVSVRTAVLPAGWEDRLVEFPRHDNQVHAAYCLDLIDLVVAKLVAGREKDIAYVSDLLASGHLRPRDVQDRVEMLEAVGGIKRRIRELVDRISPEPTG